MPRKSISSWGDILIMALIFLSVSSALAQAPMLAFISDRSRDDELYVMFENGEQDVIVFDLTRQDLEIINVSNATGEGVGIDIDGAWSPDGTMIAFQGGRPIIINGEKVERKPNIYVADMTGRRPAKKQWNVTNSAEPNQKPSWSPDSKQIVFESKRDGDWEIFVLDVDPENLKGENLRQLTNNDKPDRKAKWSRSGIAFESNRDGNSEIYRMDSDGANQTNLTNDPGKDSDPLWAPDGKKVLFSSRRDGNREVYVMDANGGALQNLTNDPGDDISAIWNPAFFQLAVESQRKHFTTLGEIKRTSLLQNFPNPFNPDNLDTVSSCSNRFGDGEDIQRQRRVGTVY